MALLYFAGHAVMHDGEVWLLPVNAAVEQAGDAISGKPGHQQSLCSIDLR